MKFPSKEEFLLLFNLFPKGNPEKAFLSVKYTIMSKKTFQNTAITWELIEESYRKYITKRKAEGVQENFIRSLDSFCENGDFNINFDAEPSQEKKNSFQTGMDSAMDELERRLNSEQ